MTHGNVPDIVVKEVWTSSPPPRRWNLSTLSTWREGWTARRAEWVATGGGISPSEDRGPLLSKLTEEMKREIVTEESKRQTREWLISITRLPSGQTTSWVCRFL